MILEPNVSHTQPLLTEAIWVRKRYFYGALWVSSSLIHGGPQERMLGPVDKEPINPRRLNLKWTTKIKLIHSQTTVLSGVFWGLNQPIKVIRRTQKTGLSRGKIAINENHCANHTKGQITLQTAETEIKQNWKYVHRNRPRALINAQTTNCI